MADPLIRIKRSAVPSKRPTLANLELGEIALNTYDGYLFARRDTGGVGIATTITNLTPWHESYGGGKISYDGFIGIGTDDPQYDLDVDGDIRLTGNLYGNNANFTGILTASSLVGDGSGITGLDHSQVTGVITGLIVKEEGSVVGTAGSVAHLNFVSPNLTVTASGVGATLTLTNDPTFSSLDVTGISTISGFEFNSGIITATSAVGVVTYYGDGSNLTGIIADGSTLRTVNRYVATQDQTLFPSSGSISYDVGYADVYLNGGKLDSTEFTATDGTTVTLTTGASVDDVVEIIAFTNVGLSTANLYTDQSPQLGGDLDLNNFDITGTGNINITGVITATSFVGNGSSITGITFDQLSDVTFTNLGQHDIAVYHDGEGWLNDPGASRVVQEVRNVTGFAITQAYPVYETGYNQGNERVTIDVANAGIPTAMPALGIIHDADLGNNSNGYVIISGIADRIDTSVFSEGDELYVAVGGGLTNTRPTGATALIQKIGTVLRSHASTGSILVQGAGRTNDVPNTISVSSSITAGDGFYGDGSGLTGNPNFNSLNVNGDSTFTGGIDVDGHTELDDVNVSGAITATTFTGALDGNAGTATALENARNFSVTGDFVTASAVSFDGTSAVALAATITTDSIILGTYTSGDYVESVSGTANEIQVTSGTGEGSTPTIGFVANPTIGGNVTIGQDLTVTRDLQVTRNLNVDGTVTIGGTSATIFAETLKISDPDLVLGFRTDANGNDISNDTTASHGGVALASTEGSPLVNLVGTGETLPTTYKKIMWFKTNSFTGLNTDAWLSNYAFGVGTTSMSSGTKFAVGNIEANFDDLTAVRNINSSGFITASSFYGDGSNLTGLTHSQVGAMGDLVDDTTPQLGGNLDLNSNDITGTGNINITGITTLGGDVKIDGDITSRFLTIVSTDSGSGAEPVITLKRDSSSPAADDQIGQLRFSGENSSGQVREYASITGKIVSPTLLAEKGAIETRINGFLVSTQTSTSLNLQNNVNVSGALTATSLSIDNFDIRRKSGDIEITNDTGDLLIAGAGGATTIKLQPDFANNSITANSGGSVELFFNNNKKLETVSTGVTITGSLDSGNVNIDGGDGVIKIGDIAGGTSTTDSGLFFDNTKKGAIFTEVDGEILSYAINVPQIDSGYDNTKAGGIFRLDTRAGGSIFNSECFVVKSTTPGETGETNVLGVGLTTGDTYLSPIKGNVAIGTDTPAGAKLDVFGTARIGGTASSARRADFDTNGRLTLAYGDNNNVSNLILANLATDATTNHGSNIAWDFGTNSSASPITAATIDVVKEQQWTSTATTRDAKFAIRLAENGVLGEKFSITSAGNVAIGAAIPVGRLDVATAGDSSIVLANETTYTDGIKRGRITKKSDNSLVIQACDSASPVDTVFLRTVSAESARIDSSGRLLVGTSSARTNYRFNATSIAPLFQLESTGGSTSFGITRNSNSGNAGTIYLAKSRGTTDGSNTIVQQGDRLGSLSFNGADGTDLVTAARIDAEVDGTPGTNDMPGRLLFFTTSNGGSTPQERMRITSAGNVGIGTAAPTANLAIKGNNSGTSIEIEGNASTDYTYTQVKNPSGVQGQIVANANSDFQLRSVGNHPIAFYTNNTEKSRIDSSGRLLVGTSSARGTIDVENTNTTPHFQLEGGTSNTAHALLTRYTANEFGAYFSLAKTRSSSLGGHQIVNNNDSLGRLRWLGDDGTDFEVAAQIEAFVDGTPGANDMPGRLVFATTADGVSSPTERMRITSAGNVGINETNPAEKLTVDGTILTTNAAYSSNVDVPYLIAGTSSYTGATTNWGTRGFQHRFKSNSGGTPRVTIDDAQGNEAFSVLNGGNIGIGIDAPGYKLEVNGDIKVGELGTLWFSDTSGSIEKITTTAASIDIYSDSLVNFYESDANTVQFTVNTNSARAYFQNDTDTYWYRPAANTHAWTTSNVERFRIGSDGFASFSANALGTTAGNTQDLLQVSTTNNNESYLKIFEQRDVNGSDWTSSFTRIQKVIDVTAQAYIQFNGNGNTYGMEFGTTGDEKFAVFERNGAVELYYDDAKKFETTSTGVTVTGLLSATTKSFVIDHPTKEGMKLRHGSLEGPENGVYIRGRLKDNNTIELPDYWTGLVDEETITVNLTPIGRKAPLHSVVDIADNTVVVESANDTVDCFYTVFGERKDVERFEVEF